MARLALLGALLSAAEGYSPFAPDFQRGIVFGGDEWSSPLYAYGSPGAQAALAALAATGASHVRLLVTGFMDNAFTATAVYSIPPPSALATTPVAALQAMLAQAQALGLQPVLCPVLDPNWDLLPPGSRSTAGHIGTWRGTIGTNYTTQEQYDAFFASYRAWVWPYYQAAAAAGAAMIEVSSELDFLFGAPLAAPAWRALVADIRALPFAGKLSVAADLSAAINMQWADALDLVGLDVYAGLGPPLPLGMAPSVDALVAGLEAAVTPQLEALLARNLSLIISETGFQSRPNCHVRPWGTQLLDPDDDSAWLLVVDTTCQSNAYEALFRYAASKPYLHGVYLWLWRSDPTTGGTYNGDFTPFAKPAEVTLRRWYGGSLQEGGGGTAALLAARQQALLEPTPQQRAAARAAITPPSPSLSLQRFHAPHPLTRRSFNGFCLGTPDEWSSPFYRLGSAGSLYSLDDMVNSTGADSLEIIAQWWFDNINSTEIYPITDAGSPLQTSTDEELAVYTAAAKARGLKTIFTLMLDPNWLLPAQAECRDTGRAGCYWRGQVGLFWGTDCSDGTPWAAWHANYASATLHYARLAQAWGMDSLLLSHELYGPSQVCPARWAALLAAVRAVFQGSVSSVVALGSSAAAQPWAADLDYLGIDCYQTIPLPANATPTLPWQDASLPDLIAAAQRTMPAFAATSAEFGGKAIVCTELGMPSRPHAYTTWGGALLLDPEDCSVWDQCVSIEAQLLTYRWWLQVYYSQPWFEGFLFWHWRADPTAGGMSSDGFTVQGKAPILQALKAYWGGAKQ